MLLSTQREREKNIPVHCFTMQLKSDNKLRKVVHAGNNTMQNSTGKSFSFKLVKNFGEKQHYLSSFFSPHLQLTLLDVLINFS